MLLLPVSLKNTSRPTRAYSGVFCYIRYVNSHVHDICIGGFVKRRLLHQGCWSLFNRCDSIVNKLVTCITCVYMYFLCRNCVSFFAIIYVWRDNSCLISFNSHFVITSPTYVVKLCLYSKSEARVPWTKIMKSQKWTASNLQCKKIF